VSAIATLKSKLGQYPHVRFVEEANTLRILPVNPDGFEVALFERGGAWNVSFAGWHEDCGTADEAVDLVGVGLSDAVRLRASRRPFSYRRL